MKNENLKMGIGLGAVILSIVYDFYMIKQYGKNIMKKRNKLRLFLLFFAKKS